LYLDALKAIQEIEVLREWLGTIPK
jgi:hypothetical protein